MNEQKIKLIYIASNGRSGSTLLDMLVGKHKNCWTLGEFQMLPTDYLWDTQPCGCGKKVSECEFWNHVVELNRKIITSGAIGKFRNFGAGKVIRWRELKELFLNFIRPIDQAAAIDEYGKENYVVLNSLLEKIRISGDNIEYLVDASKDPYRLKWLGQSGYFDIMVLHIIKKPESFVFSMTKNEKPSLKKLSRTLRFCIRWIVENILIETVTHKFVGKGKYLKIRYEDLATDPSRQTKIIFEFLGLDDFDMEVGDFMHHNHAVSGNQMRFKTGEVVLDNTWKSRMGSLYILTTRLITYPFSNLYNTVSSR